MTQSDLLTLLPPIVLVSWTILLLLVDLWIPANRKGLTALLAALGITLTLGLNISHFGRSMTAFNGMAVVDGFTVFINSIFLLSGLAAVGLAFDYLKRRKIERGEYYPLLMFSISGMMLMAYANDLIVVFLSLELLSIPLYVLAGFAHPHLDSEESSLKYFLLGTFAAAFVLYGTALVYGASGHTDLTGIVMSITSNSILSLPLLLVGAGLLLVGFAFKTAVVPFHGWAPDVYQGAPTPVTGFMAIGAKAAGVAALLRIFMVALPELAADLTPAVWVLAALTMLVGNIGALGQKNIKRLLGYSSIANGGYLMMAFVTYGNADLAGDTVSSMLFYLLAYALSSLAAWAVIISLEQNEGKGLEVEDYAGLGKSHPMLALVMLVAMLSFSGVPLTMGFWGKFYLFRTVVQAGFTGLAVLGILTSVVSVFYYLRVVVMMFMKPGKPEVSRNVWLDTVAVVSAAAVLLLSFFPNSLFDLAVQALLR